jgi:arsenate reductase
MKYQIYHNNRCSKSRQTLDLLQQNKIEPEIIEYLKIKLDHTELEKILEILEKNGHTWQEMAREKFANKEEMLEAITKDSSILQRPIVLKWQEDNLVSAAIGRPPENVLKIIE